MSDHVRLIHINKKIRNPCRAGHGGNLPQQWWKKLAIAKIKKYDFIGILAQVS
jgi:hypothetical protein